MGVTGSCDSFLKLAYTLGATAIPPTPISLLRQLAL